MSVLETARLGGRHGCSCLCQDTSRWREDLVYFEVDFPEALPSIAPDRTFLAGYSFGRVFWREPAWLSHHSNHHEEVLSKKISAISKRQSLWPMLDVSALEAASLKQTFVGPVDIIKNRLQFLSIPGPLFRFWPCPY